MHVSLPLINKLKIGTEQIEACVTHLGSIETPSPLSYEMRSDVVKIQVFVPLNKSCTCLCGLSAS